jgi:hypothetical protein
MIRRFLLATVAPYELFHHDIKPANVMIYRKLLPTPFRVRAAEGEGVVPAATDLADLGKPLILDFGLALGGDVGTTMTVDRRAQDRGAWRCARKPFHCGRDIIWAAE